MEDFGTRRPPKLHISGVTLPETLVAVVLLATFFASIFELNAICLRYIDATKESVAVLQHVQDRAEILRNLAFTDLTNTAAVQTLMATAPNAAPFAAKATETVKISAFPAASGVTQFTRTPDGTVTTDSVAPDLGKELVKVEVQVAWSMSLGGRSRTEQTTNILSNGTKKMKLKLSLKHFAFTLPEMTLALAASSVVLGATLTSSTSLQKSFNAVDNYFGTHMQQIRIVDYLSRDVKRGLIVTTSADLQTVTVTMPNYIIQPGDPEAVANPALVGTARTPTMVYTPSGWQVNYGNSTSTVVYSISGTSILRTENGTVTTIASSTDELVPKTTDVELANTEYTKTSITFQPIFTSNGAPAARSGTTVFSTAYLRNKRRG